MPYQQVWVEPEIALEYEGVTVYNAYKENDIKRKLYYCYSLFSTEDNRNVYFDIRKLSVPAARELVNAEYVTSEEYGELIHKVLKQAIDAGLLKPVNAGPKYP